MDFEHTPVLLQQVVDGLALGPGARWADCTLGGAGHALALLAQTAPDGRLLGLDADAEALAAAAARIAEALGPDAAGRTTLAHAHNDALGDVARVNGFPSLDGALFDLGVSSYQLDTAGRGFSFQHDGPLDMRLDQSQGPTAADLLEELDELELADIIYRYGEERGSRRIARFIAERRKGDPPRTTAQLAGLVAAALGGRRGPIHPATRTFQALRIAVNGELDRLERALPQAVDLLAPGGRLAVISFHSLEDRIVKLFMRDESGYAGGDAPSTKPARLRIITRKPLVADEGEQRSNPRARSAKLRIAEKLRIEN